MAELNDYTALRTITRAHLDDLWNTAQESPGSELSAEDEALIAALNLHPEFVPLWGRLSHFEDRDFMVGDMNPIVHVTMDAIVESQYRQATPPEVVTALDTLMQAGFSRMRAIHVIGRVLTYGLFAVLRNSLPFNTVQYQGRLSLMAKEASNPRHGKTTPKKIGRNDPCPCGSGLKFKKCCIEVLPFDLDPNHWSFLLQGGEPYMLDSGQEAPDDEPARILQNLSAVANALERAGDFEGVLATYARMTDVATETGIQPWVDAVAQDAITFGLNHPSLAPQLLRYSQSLFDHVDDQEVPAFRLTILLDHANFLNLSGHAEEAQRVYDQAQNLVEDFPHDDEVQEIFGNYSQDFPEAWTRKPDA